MPRNMELRDSEKESLWRKRIAEYIESGRTVRSFCEIGGFSEQSFYWWKRTLARRDSAATAMKTNEGFSEVRIIPDRRVAAIEGVESNPSGNSIEVVLKGGCLVRVLPGFDVETLLRLFDVLESRSC